MEKLMSFSTLSHALNAHLFAGEGKQIADKGFSSVSIDSREINPGGLFVALRGATLDGHRFVEAAFKAGASAALVCKSALEDKSLDLHGLCRNMDKVIVVVDNTLKALQDAAAFYIKQFNNLLRIGITGSSGKTSTKEIASAIISQEKSLVMNKGNYNSETGLPLSVFNIRSHHQVGIFEAAMNHPGEIADLAKILNPHLALITNIGTAHVGNMGSKEAIAKEKKDIFSCFTGENKALIPDEDDYRDYLAKDLNGKVIFYGSKKLSPLSSVKNMGLTGTEFIWDGVKCNFSLPGKHNFYNAISAIALSMEVPVSNAAIRKGLESVKPLFGRGEILRGRTTLIRDCYNSNPDSAKAAIDFCDSLDWPGRKVYVLGSMMELGALCEEAHEALGERLVYSRGSKIFLYGKEMEAARNIMEEKNMVPCFYTGDKEELSLALDSYIETGDLVLLKASRACALESLTEMLVGDAYVL